MSIEAMTLVLNHSKATGRAKLVLIGIANHQGEQGAWPSIETLARYANSSERSVMRDIQELEELGELVVERNAAPIRGQYRPNLYWVNVSSGVTDFASGVTDSPSGVTDEVVRGDTVVTLNLNNPKEKLKELNVHFEEFWKTYPRKQGKGEARRAFAKAVVDAEPSDVIAGARRYANDPNRSPSFTAMPATWLNQERWDDEPLPERVLSAEEKKQHDLDELATRRQREAEQRAERDARERAEREAFEREKAENPIPRCEHGRVLFMCRVCSESLS